MPRLVLAAIKAAASVRTSAAPLGAHVRPLGNKLVSPEADGLVPPRLLNARCLFSRRASRSGVRDFAATSAVDADVPTPQLSTPREGTRPIPAPVPVAALPPLERSVAELQVIEDKTPDVHIELGSAWARGRDYAAAEGSFRRALALDQGATPAWVGLGRLYADRGDAERAISALERAIAERDTPPLGA